MSEVDVPERRDHIIRGGAVLSMDPPRATTAGVARTTWRHRIVVASLVATGLGGLSGGAPVRGAVQGEPIPITPLDRLTTLSASVVLDVVGTVEGDPTSGDLVATLAATDEGTSRIDVTGSLLGDVVALVGGSAVRLFRPNRVTVYTVPDGTYVVLDALVDVCVKPRDSTATDVLAQLSPANLMKALTASDVARGTLVGREELDGRAVDHWIIDGAAFLEAARSSDDPNVSRFAGDLTGATDADVYVSTDSGFPVAYRGGFSGPFEPLRFDGDLGVRIDLLEVDDELDVVLPGSCDHPIAA